MVYLIAILSLFSYYCNSVGQGMEGQHKVRPCKAGQHAPIHGAGRGWDKATTLQSTHDPAQGRSQTSNLEGASLM